MKDMHWLNTKLTATKLPEICLLRHALVNKFQQETSMPVIFVSAPAGYSKTISTLLWLKSSGRETIWIRLDAYDNSISVFYKQFCSGLLSLQPNNKAMADIFNSPIFSSSPVEHTVNLLSEFIPERKQYALVFDDMHLIANSEIQKSLSSIVKRLPLSFVTLILTRNVVSDDELSMLEDIATVITAKDLIFSANEIRQYFKEFNRNITKEEAAAVYALTGGWAIGVNALAMSGQMELGQKYEQILDSYIKKQIWDHWDEDLRDFMMRTSIVDEMTASLCKELTGREDSRELLNSLYSSNSFITHLGGETYSYHQLFLDFLRNQLSNAGIDTKNLYKIAALYYIDSKYYMAKYYGAKSLDYEVIVRLLHNFSHYNQLPLDEYVKSSEILLQIDMRESICEKFPFLYATRILVSSLCGDASDVEYSLDRFYDFLQYIELNYPQYKAMVFLALCADYRVTFTVLCERLNNCLPLTDFYTLHWSAGITFEMPLLHRSGRDFSELVDEKIMEKYKQIHDTFQEEKLQLFFSGMNCGLLYERGLLKESLAVALHTQNIISENTISELGYTIFLHQAMIYYGMGNPKQTDMVIKEAESYIEKSGAHYLRPNFFAYKAKLQMYDGDKAAAQEWLDNYFVTETVKLECYKIHQHFTTARAYITLGQTENAMKMILMLKQLGTDFHRPLDIAEAGVLQAILEWASGKRKEAQLLLETILTNIQPFGFIRIIAEEGAAILPVLKKVVSKVDMAGYKGELLSRYVRDVYLATYEQAKRHKGIAVNISEKPVNLSKQQKLIISLLSQGYRNSEIIRLTGLSLSTVKQHTAASYRKLNVNNAADAVLKAKKIGII